MNLLPRLLGIAQWLADRWFALLPRRRPSPQRIRACKIIAHRGTHDNRQVRENTLAAFDPIVDSGLWAIEFDIRWTRDYIPVVIHDPDTRRVFGVNLVVAEVEFEELRERVPEIPTLAEVVVRYGKRIHLMIEIKADPLPDPTRKRESLLEVLGELKPAQDYHLLALQTGLFALADFAGDAACIAVAELNVSRISAETLQRNFAGIGGQYLLLGNRLLERHARQGQFIGTGFIASRFCLYRELNRGVEWIYTNHPLKLGAIRRQLLNSNKSQ